MGSRQASVYAGLLVTFTLATISIVSRFCARYITKTRLWLDDYLSAAAYLVSCIYLGCVLRWLSLGLGLHIANIPKPLPEAIADQVRFAYSITFVYNTSLYLSMVSILCVYWHLFHRSSIRLPIQVLWVLASALFLIRTFMGIFQCNPPKANWDPTIKNAKCNIDISILYFATVFTRLLLEVVVLILPIFEIRKLQLDLSRKVAVMGMFAAGAFVSVATIMQLVYVPLRYKAIKGTSDLSYTGAHIAVWASVEVNLAIVASCLPILRPIWVVFILRRPLGSLTNSNKPIQYSGNPYSGKRDTVASNKRHLDTLNAHGSSHIDAESTYELTRVSENGGEETGSEREGSTYNKHAHNTVITAIPQDGVGKTDPEHIVVQEEYSVKYSKNGKVANHPTGNLH